jgi:2-phospho-L-lactate guanylyltransferase
MSWLEEAKAERGTWIVIPFKGPVGSKRRLAGFLAARERELLSRAMFENVMNAALHVEGVSTVLLLTPSRDFGATSRTRRLRILEDAQLSKDDAPHTNSLNWALKGAQQLALKGGADRLLIVPADLPLLTQADLSAIIEAGDDVSVVIAPDRHRRGTNALLLSPPDAIEPAFGEESLLNHTQAAEAADLSAQRVERAGLMIDLDTPDDVELMLEIGGNGPIVRLLREFGVAERLQHGASR